MASVLAAWSWMAGMAVVQAPATVPHGAAPVAVAHGSPSADIVVVGTRVNDARKVLDACIARRCTPAEEIDASLRLTDAHFLAGDYENARRVLSRASARNSRYAAQLPEKVADLNRARSVIAAHIGEREWRIREAGRTIDSLEAGLPSDDQRVFIERLRLGDTNLATGRVRSARQVFSGVASDARAANNTYIEAAALLRLATVYTALARARGGAYPAQARATLARVEALHGPELGEAKLMAAQLGKQLRGNAGATPADRAAALWTADAPVDRPILLYAPPDKEQAAFGADDSTPDNGRLDTANRTALSAMSTSYIPDQWIDVTFWIEPDGRVADTKVSQRGEHTRDFWVNNAVTRVAGRRYAPVKQRMMRVERVTRTANQIGVPGWKIRRRSPLIRYVTTDITPS